MNQAVSGETVGCYTFPFAVKSQTLDTMLNERCGCRNDDWGGERVWGMEDVVRHEMTALHNLDILFYVKANYSSTLVLPPGEDGDDQRDAFSYAAPEYADDVVDFIKSQFLDQPLYAIWLTTEEQVLNLYDSGKETWVSTYKIPKDAMVISDLDEDGVLFVTATHPHELGLSVDSKKKSAWKASTKQNVETTINGSTRVVQFDFCPQCNHFEGCYPKHGGGPNYISEECGEDMKEGVVFS